MFFLTNSDVSYLLINPKKSSDSELENQWNSERVCSVLYSKDFEVIPLKEFYENIYTEVYLGVTPNRDDDEIRKEALDILHFLDLDKGILKYNSSKNPVEIDKFGSETPLELSIYESDENSKIYIHQGVYFSFKKEKRYFIPKDKKHLKDGMVVEYLNQGKWNSKQIENLDQEFDKMYELLMRYGKLRIPNV